MKLLERLNQVVKLIEQSGLRYSLAGGLVASLYRQSPRATADIDVVILTEDPAAAESILRTLGLSPHSLRQADLEGGPLFAIKRKSTPILIVCGRDTGQSETIGVDLILARIPWARTALERAQANRVDFGFGPVPCLTLEDLFLSKTYAVTNQSSRFMDLDDLKSILVSIQEPARESTNNLDWAYLQDQMKDLRLKFPDLLTPFIPKHILKGTNRRR